MNACAEEFIENLKAKDLTFDAKVDGDGDSLVVFPMAGKTFFLFFIGEKGESLLTRCVVESVPEDKTIDVMVACNQLNYRFRWVKFYLDSDNDFCIQNDAIIQEGDGGEEAFRTLLQDIEILKEAKPIIMKAIYS